MSPSRVDNILQSLRFLSRVEGQGSRVKCRGFNFLLKIAKLVHLLKQTKNYKIGIFDKRAYNKSPASSLLVFNERL